MHSSAMLWGNCVRTSDLIINKIAVLFTSTEKKGNTARVEMGAEKMVM